VVENRVSKSKWLQAVRKETERTGDP